MKETHEANFARSANVEILIPHNAILVKYVHNIDAIQLNLKKKRRRSALTTQKAKRNATLPAMKVVPKLTPKTTFEDWHNV